MSKNGQNLIELARQKFGTLTEAEEKLFQAVADAEVADYSAEDEEDNDPAGANNWGPERVLDANSIAWLCTDKRASDLVTHSGIQLKGGRIVGKLDLEFTKILFPLIFVRSSIPQEMNLLHVEIPVLILDGTHTGTIKADGLKVAGSVFLRNGFEAEGELRLLSATIGGDLDCSNGQFIGQNGRALNADGLKVAGSVLLRNGFEAEGEVNLRGATIGGNLECEDGQFINPNECALKGNQLNVMGSVFLHFGFIAKGEVRLPSASIGSNLECDKGQFINPNGAALNGEGLKVAGNVFLREGFKAEGKVDLFGANIGKSFQWRDVILPEKAELDLRFAKIGTLRDDPNSWPESGKLLLHGLVYDQIHDKAPRDAKSRIEWIRLQYDNRAEEVKGQFRSQPYEQLAAVFRKSGLDEDAKKILIDKNRDIARLTKLTLSERFRHGLFGLIIAYGYDPWRAVWFGLVIVLVGWLFFWAGYRADVLTLANEGPDTSGGFHALVYSLDVFVPLVDLRQASYWLPNANRAGKVRISDNINIAVSGKVLRYYFWFEIIAGWVLTTLLVVGVTGLVRT